MHPPRFGFLNPIHLSLGAYLGFELGNGAQHIKEEAAGRISGVDVLIEHVEMHLLLGQGLGDLAQMQGANPAMTSVTSVCTLADLTDQ